MSLIWVLSDIFLQIKNRNSLSYWFYDFSSLKFLPSSFLITTEHCQSFTHCQSPSRVNKLINGGHFNGQSQALTLSSLCYLKENWWKAQDETKNEYSDITVIFNNLHIIIMIFKNLDGMNIASHSHSKQVAAYLRVFGWIFFSFICFPVNDTSWHKYVAKSHGFALIFFRNTVNVLRCLY